MNKKADYVNIRKLASRNLKQLKIPESQTSIKIFTLPDCYNSILHYFFPVSSEKMS